MVSDNNTNRQTLIDMLQEKGNNQEYIIEDKDCRRIVEQIKYEKEIAPVRLSIVRQYVDLLKSTSIKGCAKSWMSEIAFSETNLHNACYDIETDLRILLARRKNLIGKDKQTGIPRPTRGKIAGITTYRLARSPIIQLSPSCIKCNQEKINKGEHLCGIVSLNTEIALLCGLYFINKSYSKIPEEIRNELIYTLNKRHTNQETLGIVFDTIKVLP